MNACITEGQAHESKSILSVLGGIRFHLRGAGRPKCRPQKLAGDKAYDMRFIRLYLRKRGIRAVIPEKRKPYGRKPGRPCALELNNYKRRSIIENCIGWLKHCRRVATRFEKLALNFLAIVQWAIIRFYLRKNLRDTT